MNNYIEKMITVATRQTKLVGDIKLSALSRRIKRNELVKSISKEDESILLIEPHNNVKGRCLFKDIGEGQFVLVTCWEIDKKEELLFHIGTTLWNDQKKASHLTYSYVTQKNLCVIESHINLRWNVTELYFTNWLKNYLVAVPGFQGHIDNLRRYFEQLPEEKLSALEKLWIGSEIAESAVSIWKILRNEF